MHSRPSTLQTSWVTSRVPSMGWVWLACHNSMIYMAECGGECKDFSAGLACAAQGTACHVLCSVHDVVAAGLAVVLCFVSL